jgi:hypothetical protein
MGSDQFKISDPPASFLFKLWLLALAGLVAPWVAVHYWPDFTWVGKAERALNRSIDDREWHEPWQALDQKRFTSGWIRCGSLEDAIRLDQRVDDGHPHTGNLMLSEGGLAWRGQ